MLAPPTRAGVSEVGKGRTTVVISEDGFAMNLPQRIVNQNQKEINGICAALRSGNLSAEEVIRALNRFFELACTNVEITREMLELMLVVINGCGVPEIAALALKSARWILRSHPRLGIEVMGSESLVPMMNWIEGAMTRDQIDFFDCLFSCDEATRLAVARYGFLDRLQKVYENECISREHRVHLLTILIGFCLSVNGESSPFVIPIFRCFVCEWIQTDDQDLFEQVMHLFTTLLESREEAEMIQFMFSGVDGLLMKRFADSRHFAQEVILRAFLAISAGSALATRLVFEKFVCQWPLSLFEPHEKLQSIVLRIASNTLSLGAAVMDSLASCGVVDLALGLQSAGKYQSRKSAICFFSNLCVIVEDPRIEAFLTERRMVSVLVEFLSVSKKDTWRDIINGLTQIRNHIEGNPFAHPLFTGVELGDFYAVLMDIHDHPGLETFDKGLYSNVGNLLELFDEQGPDYIGPL
jgi:hypothetical protein